MTRPATRYAIAGVLFALTTAPLTAQQQSPPPPVALRAARMLDVKAGRIVQNAVVLIQGANITAAGANVPVPGNARVLELGDVTVLPGLIDTHTHLLQNYNGVYEGDDPNMVLTVTTLGTTRRASCPCTPTRPRA